jgi:hypothetical protein
MSKIIFAVKATGENEQLTALYDISIRNSIIRSDGRPYSYPPNYAIFKMNEIANFALFVDFHGISKKVANFEVRVASRYDRHDQVGTIDGFRLRREMAFIDIIVYDETHFALGLAPEANIQAPFYPPVVIEGNEFVLARFNGGVESKVVITQVAKFECLGIDLLDDIIELPTMENVKFAMRLFGIDKPMTIQQMYDEVRFDRYIQL